mmetsp:Transcript_25198/g.68476  ORF Transcript_25198/g.68476 Transcript_25198/m.68476 type:complete len:251 (-) Transcript_25198:240-992(-)
MAGPARVCSRHDAGCEEVCHALHAAQQLGSLWWAQGLMGALQLLPPFLFQMCQELDVLRLCGGRTQEHSPLLSRCHPHTSPLVARHKHVAPAWRVAAILLPDLHLLHTPLHRPRQPPKQVLDAEGATAAGGLMPQPYSQQQTQRTCFALEQESVSPLALEARAAPGQCLLHNTGAAQHLYMHHVVTVQASTGRVSCENFDAVGAGRKGLFLDTRPSLVLLLLLTITATLRTAAMPPRVFCHRRRRQVLCI